MGLDTKLEPPQDIKSLLEENLKYSKEIYLATKKTRHYILWAQIFGFLKVLIIMVPLVLGFLYVQPYLKSMLGAYQSLFGQGTPGGGGSGNLPSLDSNLFKQFQKLQESGQLQDIQKLLK